MRTEQTQAQDLLTQRAHDRLFSRRSLWRYMISLSVPAILYAEFKMVTPPAEKTFLIFMAGLMLGLIIRDIAGLYASNKQWPFMRRIINWSIVESIAKADKTANQGSERTGVPLRGPPSVQP